MKLCIVEHIIQWNPYCEATPFALESGLSRGVASHKEQKSIPLCLDFKYIISSSVLSRRGGLSKGVPMYYDLVM